MVMERDTIWLSEGRNVRSGWSLTAIAQAVASEVALHRSRRALLQLDDAHLRDIGITRAAARAEAARSFLTDV